MVTVDAFDASSHTGKVSQEGFCAQGGQDTCKQQPVFSVLAENFNIAACDQHLAGAVRHALGLPARS